LTRADCERRINEAKAATTEAEALAAEAQHLYEIAKRASLQYGQSRGRQIAEMELLARALNRYEAAAALAATGGDER
jgi:hypothetical protein